MGGGGGMMARIFIFIKSFKYGTITIMRLAIIIIMRTKYHNTGNLIRKIPGDVMCCNVMWDDEIR